MTRPLHHYDQHLDLVNGLADDTILDPDVVLDFRFQAAEVIADLALTLDSVQVAVDAVVELVMYPERTTRMDLYRALQHVVRVAQPRTGGRA